MKSATMTLVLTMMLLSLTAGDACDKVPMMTWSAACLRRNADTASYNLCQEMLQNVPDSAVKVTVFAIASAKAAAKSYGATASAAAERLRSSLPADERAAVQLCRDRSATAQGHMLAVVNDMSTCRFQNTLNEYRNTISTVNSCREALHRFPSSPLVAKNKADRDATEVAYSMGSLVLFS